MLTLTAGGSNAIYLNAGQSLTVQGGPNSSGTVYKCLDSAGANSQASYAVGANSSQTIGPFGTNFIMLLYCSAGFIVAGETTGAAFVANKTSTPSSGIAPYLGIVATRCGCLNPTFVAGMVASTNRSAHFATEDLTSIQVVYPNWTAGTNTEANMDSAASLVCYIEYPIDVYTPVTFAGASSAAAAAGANFISDFISVNIPRGALFYVRAGFGLTGSTVNGIPTNNYSIRPNWGSGTTTGSYWEGVLNSASLGSVSLAGTKGSGGTSGNNDGFNTQADNRIVPLGILGMTTRPSFFIAGDSVAASVGDVPDSQLAAGFIARALGNRYGYFNAAVSGEQVNGLTNNAQYLQRSFMAQYCTHVICQYGTNDIGVSSGRTAAQVIADISAFRNKWFAGKRFYQCTLLPRTTSTDSFITETNQTPVATDSVRAAFNDQLRLGALTTRFDGILDVDQIVQNSYIGRKWKAFGTTTNALTADGTHPTTFGSQYIAAQLNMSRVFG
jgi:lysophospholipase L1-like esterase